MYQITKKFKGYPFAHRQHTHDGHCSLIHGHNWDFEITLESTELDENGFVYDFGKFGWLKDWLEAMFDHTCLINQDDPKAQEIENFAGLDMVNLHFVESCSSEGIAKLVFNKLKVTLEDDPLNNSRGVRIVCVTVYEDYKNSATYYG